MQNTKKRILMVVAPENFRDIEYIVPAAFFKQNNMEVITTSSAKESVGRFGYQLQHTFLIDEINGNSYDALFIVGGIGCLQFKEHEALKRLCLEFAEQQKPLAAICAAPQLLLHWGILTGRNCTGFNDADQTFEKLAHMHKAHPLVEEAVVVSDFIVTGSGPAASDVMAQKFIEIVRQRA